MTPRRLALLALALVASSAQARAGGDGCPYDGPKSQLTIEPSAPALEYTVTKIDMSWFAPSGRSGPELFRLVVRNLTDVDYHIVVWAQIAARPADPILRARCHAKGMDYTGFAEGDCSVQNEVSAEPFLVPARGVRVTTSAELFSTTFYTPTSQSAVSPFNSEFSDLIRDLGYVPDGQIMMKFAPVCARVNLNQELGNVRFSPGTAKHRLLGPVVAVQSPITNDYPEYRSVSEIRAVLPGAPVAEAAPEISSSRPNFSFQSELANRTLFRYPPGQKRFELRLWKLAPGQDPRDAVSRRPLHSFETDETDLPFPTRWAPLEPGASYVWRVDARLIGPVTEPLSSEVHGFRVAANTIAAGELTPDQSRLLELLRIILGPRYDDMMRSVGGRVPDIGSLRVDGRPVTIEDLERMAADHEAQRIHVVGMRLP